MANFRQDILRALKNQEESTADVVSVKIPALLDTDFGESDARDTDELKAVVGKLISADLAMQLLDYEYDAGFGSMDCHDILIWTTNRIHFIHEYDGATELVSLPRSPE